VGSPYYMAPEIIKKEGYDELVDWWSIGCILYEMVIGFPPFMGETPQEVFGNILDHESLLEFPEEDEDFKITRETEDFIRQLLSPENTRLGRKCGFQEIKEHPFLRDVEWDKLRQKTPPFVPHLDSPTDTSYFHLTKEEKQNSNGSKELSTMANKTEKTSSNTNGSNQSKHHRRGASYDFVGFTFKPTSWLDATSADFRFESNEI